MIKEIKLVALCGTYCRELRPEAKIKPGVKGVGVAIEAFRGGSQRQSFWSWNQKYCKWSSSPAVGPGECGLVPLGSLLFLGDSAMITLSSDLKGLLPTAHEAGCIKSALLNCRVLYKC